MCPGSGAVAMSINLQPLGSFDPGALAVLYQAFDDVWLQLEGATRPDLREITRNAIAMALIDAAMSGERDPEKLWAHAMRRGRAVCTLDWMAQESPAPPLPRAGARLFGLKRSSR
jgi:hypothetical protein